MFTFRLRISVWRTPASPSLGLLNTNKDNSGYIKNIGAGNMGFEAKVCCNAFSPPSVAYIDFFSSQKQKNKQKSSVFLSHMKKVKGA